MRKSYNGHEPKESYVVGNNAVVLDNYVDENTYENKNRQNMNSNKKEMLAVSINPACTFLLASVIIALIIICVGMLKAQFSVVDASDDIIMLKNELNDLKRSNEQLAAQINEKMDLNEIRTIAINDYGMVYPVGRDVVEVKPEASSYTIQYTSIEVEEDEKMTIGSMMAFITRGW